MRRSGFSLVELSIVLVILGLLTGGILTGQNLIRAAQLRAIPVEFQQYQTAVMSFQDKYRQLPGDMRNATDFFGKAAVCPPTSAAPLTGRETCNGDGDGMIEAAAVTANEHFTFWQHLSNGGMIEGSYSGASASGAYNTLHVILGTGAPESRIAKSGWWPAWWGEITVVSSAFVEGTYNNVLHFGAEVINSYPTNLTVNPEEAWNIDKKMDDGIPSKGKLVVREDQPGCYLLSDGSAGALSTTAARIDITYNLANKTKVCSLVFRDVF